MGSCQSLEEARTLPMRPKTRGVRLSEFSQNEVGGGGGGLSVRGQLTGIL